MNTLPFGTLAACLLLISFTSEGGVDYRYQYIRMSVSLPEPEKSTFLLPRSDIPNVTQFYDGGRRGTERVCAADEATLKSSTNPISNPIAGSVFYSPRYVPKKSTKAVWDMEPVRYMLSDPSFTDDVIRTHTLFCALRERGHTLGTSASGLYTIVRFDITLVNVPVKPRPVLELPGSLILGDITPDQTVEAAVPVVINCATCPAEQITQGTISWRLESSPENPSTEKPSMIFMGAESAGKEGNNVVTFGRYLTEVTDYTLRWPRTNSAPLVPGNYRWTLTMTLSVQ